MLSVSAFLLSGDVGDFLTKDSTNSKRKPILFYPNLQNYTFSICFADAIIEALSSIDCIQNPDLCEKPGFKELVAIMKFQRTKTADTRPAIIQSFYAKFQIDCLDIRRIYNSAESKKGVLNVSDDFLNSYFRHPEIITGNNKGQADSLEFLNMILDIYEPAFKSFYIRRKNNVHCFQKNLDDANPSINDLKMIMLDFELPFEKQIFFTEESFVSETSLNPTTLPFCGSGEIHFHQIRVSNETNQVLLFYLNRAEDESGHKNLNRNLNYKAYAFPENFTTVHNHSFRLKSIVCKNGNIKGGHYCTFAKRNDECWYFLDDVRPESYCIGTFKDLMQIPYVFTHMLFLFYEIAPSK